MSELNMSWYKVRLRNDVTHKIWAADFDAAKVLVLHDKELVSPQNRQAEEMARPVVTLWEAPLKAQPPVKGDFQVGDSMVVLYQRTFVKRAKR